MTFDLSNEFPFQVRSALPVPEPVLYPAGVRREPLVAPLHVQDDATGIQRGDERFVGFCATDPGQVIGGREAQVVVVEGQGGEGGRAAAVAG